MGPPIHRGQVVPGGLDRKKEDGKAHTGICSRVSNQISSATCAPRTRSYMRYAVGVGARTNTPPHMMGLCGQSGQTRR